MESMQKPGFQFLWKLKLNNDPRQLNSLTPPVLMDRYIGYKGFRSLGFVGGSSDRIFAIDTDLARMEWQIQFTSGSPPPGGSLDCPGGLTSALTRATIASMSAAPAGRFGGFGRGGAARSAVGEPDQGAVTLAQAAAARGGAGFPGAPPGGPGSPAAPGAPRPGAARPGGPGGFGGGFGQAAAVYALSGDGMLHFMNVAHGLDVEPPVKFLPLNANAQGLIFVDGVAYVATTNGCGGVANGIWALDLDSKQVASWKASGGVAGSAGPAMGPDGTLYVATTEGELAALEPKTLKLKDSYMAGKQGFTSSPVIFEYKSKALLAATTKDGRMHLLDTAALGGADRQTPLYKTDVDPKATDFVAGALASWLDAGGTRWVLAPTAGAIVAWKVVDRSGAPVLEPGWVSRDMVSPLPPMIINGVVFAVSSGEFRTNDGKVTAAQRAQRSSPAVLYALDGATGKELWNSGKTITSFARGGLTGGGSQLYLGTYDGTLYAFGFPIEH
jgi:outer membrane protein assembly factor BamB